MDWHFDWQRLRASTIAIEVVQFGVALLALALGWVSFPQLFLLLIFEYLLSTLWTSAYSREPGTMKYVNHMVVALLLCGITGAFAFGCYAGADGFRNGLTIEPGGFAVLAGLVVVRLSMFAIQASRSAEPRLLWARTVGLRGASLHVTMMLAAIASVIPGLPLAMLLTPLLPDFAADVVIGVMYLLVQGGTSLVYSTMSDKELAELSKEAGL